MSLAKSPEATGSSSSGGSMPIGVLEAVAREQVIAAGRQVVVDADVELVDVVVEDAVRDEVVVEEAGAGHVRHREQADQLAPPTGSKHDRLMILLTASTQPAGTNGLLATMLPVSSLRSPARIRAVGTVAVCDSARSVRDDW